MIRERWGDQKHLEGRVNGVWLLKDKDRPLGLWVAGKALHEGRNSSLGPTTGIIGCREQNICISADEKSQLVPMLETRLIVEETSFTGLLQRHLPCFCGEMALDITGQPLAMWQTFSISIFSCPHHLSSHNSSSPQHLIISLS